MTSNAKLIAALMGSSVGLCALLTTGVVRAEDLNVPTGSQTVLGGVQLYDDVVVAGTLNVKPYDVADPQTGYLHLKAHRIELAAGGIIDASGKGYRGASPMGSGNGTGVGGSPMVIVDMAQPGGGGAHIGGGGAGFDAACGGAIAGATAGIAYDDAMMALVLGMNPIEGMGSSGGTSHAGPPNNNTTQPGGHGGGAVVLEAATVVVNGTIVADGDSANALFNSGPGGGAGGSIVIKSNIFTFDPATASMSARGGDGASGASLGGSGGGGLILFISDDNSSTVPTDVTGGAAVLDNGGTPCAGTAGTAGIVQLLPENATCIDADGDGAPNEDCDHAGGNDCEDGNPNVSPDLPELCNNIDDNCDGQVDEGDDDASGAPPQLNCSVTEICVNGACVQPEVDAGIDAPAPEAPETRLRGGIGGTECAASSIGADGSHWGMHAAWITALLAALGLRRRR